MGRWTKQLALAAILLVATSAHAEDKVKARAAYQIGTQHYDLAEYKEALASFKEAYRNYEDPTILFNIGQCYRQLNDKDQAIRFYRTYLIKQPDSPRADEVRSMISRLEKMQSEEKAASASPPQGTIPPESSQPPLTPLASPTAPSPAASTPAPASSSAALTASAPPRKTPIYKKWWFWTITGVVVVGAVGVGLGLGLTQGSTPSASTDFGTVHPF